MENYEVEKYEMILALSYEIITVEKAMEYAKKWTLSELHYLATLWHEHYNPYSHHLISGYIRLGSYDGVLKDIKEFLDEYEDVRNEAN